MRADMGGSRYGGAEGYRPKVMQKVDTAAVPCPTCGVGVGEQCLNAAGVERKSRHEPRRRMATRKMHEEGAFDEAPPLVARVARNVVHLAADTKGLPPGIITVQCYRKSDLKIRRLASTIEEVTCKWCLRRINQFKEENG